MPGAGDMGAAGKPGAGDMGAVGKPGVRGLWRLANKRHFSIGTSEKSAKIKKAINT